MGLGRIVLRNLLSMNVVFEGARLRAKPRLEEQQKKCLGDHETKRDAFTNLKPW